MRPAPSLRRERARCRSRTMAAPRMVARDWSCAIEMTVTGEFFGTLTLTDPLGRGASCAHTAAAPMALQTASRKSCPLLRIRIDGIDRHVAWREPAGDRRHARRDRPGR